MSRVLVAITGASGALYGVRLVQRLLDAGVEIEAIVSDAARRVLGIEQGLTGNPSDWLTGADGRAPRIWDPKDIAAPPASGSRAPQAMIIAPCSMGTVGRLAAGISGSLIERAADVMLKERRPLVIVPRETPLSTLHLRNLLTLSELGVHVVPAAPAFYHHPADIEDLVAFVVDRAITCAGLDLPLRHPWRPPVEES
jgi:4-hydroxy-3-polyprenylbenzoate decarboxylase